MLVRPKYIALDSSHLGQWAAAHMSPDASHRTIARRFERWLETSGHLPLVCLHHIAELASHENAAVAAMRLRFIASLPIVAWIGTLPERGVGTVVTLFAEELRAALTMSTPEIGAIRDQAKRNLISVGTGAELLAVEPDLWLALRDEFVEQAEQARKVVAFTRVGTVDISKKPMAELLSGRLREGENLRRQLNLMEGAYAEDIRRRGDQRIADPAQLAKDFMGDVEEMARGLPMDTRAFVLGALARQGVTEQDITPASTVGEMLDLGLFRAKAAIVAEAAGLEPAPLRAMRPNCIPTWTVEQAIERHLPDLPRYEGGELNDTSLVCLAAYADVTSVDKRTLEGVRRLRQKQPGLARLLGRIVRAASFDQIPSLVET